MTIVTLDGKTYRVSPTGLVWAGYTRPSEPWLGMLWRRMARGSRQSRLVRIAAGIEAPEAASAPRPRDRHYADRHCI
jgi:hypothetical protein